MDKGGIMSKDNQQTRDNRPTSVASKNEDYNPTAWALLMGVLFGVPGLAGGSILAHNMIHSSAHPNSIESITKGLAVDMGITLTAIGLGAALGYLSCLAVSTFQDKMSEMALGLYSAGEENINDSPYSSYSSSSTISDGGSNCGGPGSNI
jgi:hypothetical protein